MNNKYIVTAIYNNLHGTELGGRPSRGYHYIHSLKSIANSLNDAKFIIYTSSDDYEGLSLFFASNIKNTNYEILIYDLKNSFYAEQINKIKNIDETKTSDRCIELQYCKLFWLNNLATTLDDNDMVYWFDAGLSYTGLIPDKHLLMDGTYNGNSYYSKIFTNNLLNNIIQYSGDRIFIIRKENKNYFWDGGLPEKYFYNTKNLEYHTIGGIFGGIKNSVISLFCHFNNLTNILLNNEAILYSEEQILTCIQENYPDLFVSKDFDIWWHENNIHTLMSQEEGQECLAKNKSFYKILEELS